MQQLCLMFDVWHRSKLVANEYRSLQHFSYPIVVCLLIIIIIITDLYWPQTVSTKACICHYSEQGPRQNLFSWTTTVNKRRLCSWPIVCRVLHDLEQHPTSLFSCLLNGLSMDGLSCSTWCHHLLPNLSTKSLLHCDRRPPLGGRTRLVVCKKCQCDVNYRWLASLLNYTIPYSSVVMSSYFRNTNIYEHQNWTEYRPNLDLTSTLLIQALQSICTISVRA